MPIVQSCFFYGFNSWFIRESRKKILDPSKVSYYNYGIIYALMCGLQVIEPVLAIAAALSVQSPFSRVMLGQSDISVRITCIGTNFDALLFFFYIMQILSHCRQLGDLWNQNMGIRLCSWMHLMNGYRFAWQNSFTRINEQQLHLSSIWTMYRQSLKAAMLPVAGAREGAWNSSDFMKLQSSGNSFKRFSR